MVSPPPVSAHGYPSIVRSQIRSNYLAAGFVFHTAYNDNVLTGNGGTPASDSIYTIAPTIAFNKTTERQHLTLSYSPGFTFYQHTSTLNAANHNATVDLEYRLSEHTTISLGDSFQKSTN